MLDGHVAAGDRDEARQARLRGQQVVVAGIEGPVLRPVSDREEVPRPVVEKGEVRVRDQAGRGASDRGEAARSGSAGSSDSRLAAQSRAWLATHAERASAHSSAGPAPGRIALVAEGAHDVHQSLRARGQRRQARRPLGRSRRLRSEQDAGFAQGLIELPGRHDPPGPAARQPRRMGAQEIERVGDAFQDTARSSRAHRGVRGRPA